VHTHVAFLLNSNPTANPLIARSPGWYLEESEIMHEARDWYAGRIVKITVDSLRKNGFTAFNVPSKDEALKKLLEIIPVDAKVGVGGSVTIREIGLVKALEERGNPVADHWRPGLSKEELRRVRRSHLTSDVFLSSSNAVTMDGKLLNADGTGNRVAAMIFGPSKVIIVAGINKIVKNAEEGLTRIRNVASPMNANRLGYKSPCGLTGMCAEDECEPPERLCHIITILERRPNETDTTIVIVGERLGY
jgi:L-lactate utilization protein LutB